GAWPLLETYARATPMTLGYELYSTLSLCGQSLPNMMRSSPKIDQSSSSHPLYMFKSVETLPSDARTTSESFMYTCGRLASSFRRSTYFCIAARSEYSLTRYVTP